MSEYDVVDESRSGLHAIDDAVVWAAEFARQVRSQYGVGLDEGWLIGWFANAMETAKRLDRVRFAESETCRTVVGQALGAASACWERVDRAGVFQADTAVGYVDDVMRYLRDDVVPDWVMLEPPGAVLSGLDGGTKALWGGRWHTWWKRAGFWRAEGPLRLRGWWRRHWWPSRIAQLDRERADWKRWHDEVWQAAKNAGVEQRVAEQAFRDRYGHEPEDGWWVPSD